MDIDWDGLRAAARDYCARAYAPYSGYPVGAAAYVDGADGTRRIVGGCNVENAGFGVTLCAECGLVSSYVATGGGTLVAFTCCDKTGGRIMPCGRCRQLLWEHGGADMLMDTPLGVMTLADVLPQAFGPGDLAGARQSD